MSKPVYPPRSPTIVTGYLQGSAVSGLAVRQYMWLARSKPIRLLLMAWGACYASDLAAFTAASVYAYRTGGAGLVGVFGLARGAVRRAPGTAGHELG
jgi:hypothetical protein